MLPTRTFREGRGGPFLSVALSPHFGHQSQVVVARVPTLPTRLQTMGSHDTPQVQTACSNSSPHVYWFVVEDADEQTEEAVHRGRSGRC